MAWTRRPRSCCDTREPRRRFARARWPRIAIIGIGGFTCLVAGLHQRSVAAEVVTESVSVTLSGTADFRVTVATAPQGRATVQLFIEACPAGSGCGGTVDHTNDVALRRTPPRGSEHTAISRWRGWQTGEDDAGSVPTDACIKDAGKNDIDPFIFGQWIQPR